MTDKFNENLKKARQSAKYSVLRGILSAGSGGRTRIRTFVYRVGLESCQIPCQKTGSGTSLTTIIA